MAQTYRITTYGRRPACAYNDRLAIRRARRLEMIEERNMRFERPDDFVHYESSEDEDEFAASEKQFLQTSFNFADYVRSRESDAKEIKRFDVEYGSRHLLRNDLLTEFPVRAENTNKIFCSQWLSSKQITFGTKCNKLMIYDVARRNLVRVPSLSGRQNSGSINAFEPPLGIYSIQINPSRTLLATVGEDNREIAVYKLPTLDPVCVGEQGHSDSIYDMCWIDDEYLVSGSKDTNMALWHVDNDLLEASDKEDVLTHRFIQPVTVKKCQTAEVVRAVVYNTPYKEIAAYSTNTYIHIWSAETFQHKMSKKLPTRNDTPCVAVRSDGLYAIGCQSYTLLLDARTLQAVRKIPLKYSGSGVKSVGFLSTVLSIGTGIGSMMFYDFRAGKYLESSLSSVRTVTLRTSRGYVFPDEGYIDGVLNIRYTPAIYTHCFDASGTRLFCAGGPLEQNLYGNYAGLWQ